MRFIFMFCVVVVATGCQVAPSNPFDPATPAAQQQAASLRGVVSALGADGVVVDVADVAVQLRGPTAPDGQGLFVDVDGVFSEAALEPGVYELSASRVGFLPAARSLLLLPGQAAEVELVVVALPAGGNGPLASHLQGLVHKGSQGALPELEQDHSGVVVEAPALGLRTVTNRSGRYDLFATAVGSLALTLSADDHLDATVDVDIAAAGDAVVVADVTLLVDGARLSGRARKEGALSHAGTVVSATNSAVAGNEVATTDDDGAFVFVDLVPGTWTVRASADAAFVPAQQLVVLDGGADVVVDDLQLARGRGTITGSALLVGAPSNGGVVVSITGAGFSTSTGDDGLFTLTGVPSGTFELAATRDGFARAVVDNVVVTAGVVVDVGSVALTRAGGDFRFEDGAFTRSLDVTLDLGNLIEGAVQMMASEDPAFVDVDAGDTVPTSFVDTRVFTLSSGDGSHTVFVQTFDVDGVAAGPFAASIVLDQTAPGPVALSINDGAAFSNNEDAQVTLSLSANDETSGVTRMRIVLDGTLDDEVFEAFTQQKIVAFPNPGVDGPRTARIDIEDRAGNVTATPTTAAITLDRLEPILVRFAIDDDALFARSPLVALTVSADGATRMALSTSSGATPAFVPVVGDSTFLLAPGDGLRSVFLRLADDAGNVTEEVEASITVDARAPTSPSLVLAGGAAFSTSSTVSASCNAVGATRMRLSIDGVNVVGGDGFEIFALSRSLTIAAGEHTVTAVYADDAGNESSAAQDTITVDSTPPSVTSVSINNDAAFANNAVVILTVVAVDAAEIQVAPDGTADLEPFIPFATTSTLTLSAGDCVSLDCKRVAVVVRDRAGNVSTPLSDTITLDTQKPPIPLIVTPSFTTSATTGLVDIAAANNDAFFLEYQVVGGPSSLPAFTRIDPNGSPTRFIVPLDVSSSTASALSFFENRIRMRAVDRAGNVSDESSIVIVTDTVLPATPVLAPTAPIVNADVVIINVDSTLTPPADATFTHFHVLNVSNDAAFFQSDVVQAQFAVPLRPGDGVGCAGVVPCLNRIDVAACDATGRCGAAVSVSVREDSTLPTTPLVTPRVATVSAASVALALELPSSDNGAVASYQVRGGDRQNFVDVAGVDRFTFTGLRPDAVNTLCVRGRDIAGNVSEESCADITRRVSTVLSARPGKERSVSLSDDVVVFFDFDEKVIIVRDLLTGIERQLTTTSNNAVPYFAENVLLEGGGIQDDNVRFYDPVTHDFTATVLSAGGGPTVTTNGVVRVNRNGTVFELIPVASTTPSRGVATPAGFSSWTDEFEMCGDHLVAIANDNAGDTEVFDINVSTGTTTQLTNDVIVQRNVNTSCRMAVWQQDNGGPLQFRDFITNTTTTVNGLQPGGAVDGLRYVFADGTGGTNGRSRLRLHDRADGSTRDLTGFVASAFERPALSGNRVVFVDTTLDAGDIRLLELSSVGFFAAGATEETRPRIVGSSVVMHEVGEGFLGRLVHVDLITDAVTRIAATPDAISTSGFALWDDASGFFVPYTTGVLAHAVRDEAGGDVVVGGVNGSFVTADAHSDRHTWLELSGSTRNVRVRDSNTGVTTTRLSTTSAIRELVLVGDGTPTGPVDLLLTVGSSVFCCRNIGAANCSGSGTLVTAAGGVGRLRAVREPDGAISAIVQSAGRIRQVNVAAGSCALAGVAQDVFLTGGQQDNPAISSQLVVWDDDVTGNSEIFAADRASGVVFNVTLDLALQRRPEIAGRRVVWEDFRLGSPDVFIGDL
jgi:hypothetical protein